MAGISKKKTKNGIKYTITYRDIYGKQHTSGLYDTKAEAKKNLKNFENKKVNGAKNIFFGEILKIFMEKAERKYAKNTIKAYRSYVNNYLSNLSVVRYDKLNVLLLQRFFDEIENLRPYTAHNVLIFCKGAVNYAIKKKIIDGYNIFDELDVIRRPQKNVNHLNFAKMLEILSACKKFYPKYYALLFFLFGSGARIGEAVALEKADYCSGAVVINKQYTANEFKRKPKTDKSIRTVYLFSVLADVLNEHIKTLPPECKLLFPNGNGNYINPNNFRKRVWIPLLKLCGINCRIRLHDIRGSYTDLLLSNGISSKFAQNQLGHEDCATTLNIYSQNSSDTIAAALEILDNKFKKCENYVRTAGKNKKSNVILFNSYRDKRQL